MSGPTLRELTRVSARIGLLSFGGPAAQIALMHKELVDDRQWLDEETYLHALSLCMLLPGPEAMQLATYAGWKLHGVRGGIIAGGLFVLPGAFVIALLALGYVWFGQLPLVQAMFTGIKAAVIVIVLQALLKISGKALHGPSAWIIAALSFVGIFIIGLPFPIIVLLAGIWGAFVAKAAAPAHAPPPFRAAGLAQTVLTWGGLWLAPGLVLWAIGHTFLIQIYLFFSTLAVVTFGGAYSVLAYMTQTVVQDFGWISTGQMIDALGLAETTPGPLILVTEFVALLAGYGAGGIWLAIAAGLTALWATFIPCFLWIFAAAPSLEALSSRPRIAGALSAITAAVVGVILNLSLWFALHVLFDSIGTLELGPIGLVWPDFASLNITAVILTAIAAGLLLGLKQNMVKVLAIMALIGGGLWMAGYL